MNNYEKAHKILSEMFWPTFMDSRSINWQTDLDEYIDKVLNLDHSWVGWQVNHIEKWNKFIAQAEGPHHVQGCFKNINPDVNIDCKCQEG